MATTWAPALRNCSMSSRNCERCRRQNGQAKPRRNTRTTGPAVSASVSRKALPVASGNTKSGAGEPSAAVDERVPMPTYSPRPSGGPSNGGLRVVLDVALHLTRSVLRRQQGHEVQRHVDAGRDARGRDHRSTVHIAIIGPDLDVAPE